MSESRSGLCLSSDKPHMHRLCRGKFTANAGEMELSSEQACSCPCHLQGTALHRLVHGSR